MVVLCIDDADGPAPPIRDVDVSRIAAHDAAMRLLADFDLRLQRQRLAVEDPDFVVPEIADVDFPVCG